MAAFHPLRPLASFISQPYRFPAALRDLHLLDLLELTGSTAASAAHVQLSQPTVSRRYRALAADLGLQPLRGGPVGRRYGHAPWLQLLRQGVNAHRLAWGVLRIGGAEALAMGVRNHGRVEWVTLGRRQQQHWLPLLEQELLDAVALQDHPPQDPAEHAPGSMPYRLLPCACGWLACRPEPQVLQLATSLCST